MHHREIPEMQFAQTLQQPAAGQQDMNKCEQTLIQPILGQQNMDKFPPPPPSRGMRRARSNESNSSATPSESSRSGSTRSDSAWSGTQRSSSTIDGTSTISTTLIPTSGTSSLRSSQKKKKRRSRTPQAKKPAEPEPRPIKYWNEYDYPEDREGGSGDDTSYLVVIDELHPMDVFFEKMAKLFNPSGKPSVDEEQQPLLAANSEIETSADDDTKADSDEEESAPLCKTCSKSTPDYGTIATRHRFCNRPPPFLTPTRTSFLLSSLLLLSLGFVLALASKDKHAMATQAGVLVAVATSLAVALAGGWPVVFRAGWSGRSMAAVAFTQGVLWTVWLAGVGLVTWVFA